MLNGIVLRAAFRNGMISRFFFLLPYLDTILNGFQCAIVIIFKESLQVSSNIASGEPRDVMLSINISLICKIKNLLWDSKRQKICKYLKKKLCVKSVRKKKGAEESTKKPWGFSQPLAWSISSFQQLISKHCEDTFYPLREKILKRAKSNNNM